MDPIIGQLMIFAGTFAPRGWELCNGQLMSIANNSALFSILGTTYGGDGITTFALPDLRGRACVHEGNGPGLPPVSLGQSGGSTTVTLTSANLPSAPINIRCSNAEGTSPEPSGNVMAVTASEDNIYGNSNASPGSMAPATLQGGNMPISIVAPFTALNWCIATEGIYPSRP